MSDDIVDPAIGKAIEQIKKGASLDQIVSIVAPKPTPLPAPEQVPVAKAITKTQREALDLLPAVFGTVVPTERRLLEATEVSSLLTERGVLKTIQTMAEDRMGDIRTVVLNHNDIVVDEALDEGEVPTYSTDKDGHYIVKSEVRGDGDATERFSIEARAGKTELDPLVLENLAQDDDIDWFTHDDYLAMTEQVRVFSEAKAHLLLKKRPDLVRAIQQATSTGNGSVAVTPRKA